MVDSLPHERSWSVEAVFGGDLALHFKQSRCSLIVLVAPLIVHRKRLDDSNPILRMKVGHTLAWLRLHI
jgi:hypothetical protein